MECSEVMQIVLVGSGNVASSLGPALQRLGHKIVQVFSRSEQSAIILANKLGCDYTLDLHSLREDADLYYICLADDALISLAEKIVEGRGESLFVHVAGCVPMDVLSCPHRGVMWPIHGFSRNSVVDDWSDIPLTIEASDDESMQVVRQIAENLSRHVCLADSEARPKIHLAAEFCCNFANHCYDLADTILHNCSVPFSMMHHIVRSTAENVILTSPHAAQTGPARRHDKKVMDYDRNLLKDNPDLLEIYNLLSGNIENNYRGVS